MNFISGMVKSSKKWDGFKSCVFKKAEGKFNVTKLLRVPIRKCDVKLLHSHDSINLTEILEDVRPRILIFLFNTVNLLRSLRNALFHFLTLFTIGSTKPIHHWGGGVWPPQW